MKWLEDARSILKKDPAARSLAEVILLYPATTPCCGTGSPTASTGGNTSFSPGCSAQLGRSFTGIEIHPGARIGRGLFIDHGAGGGHRRDRRGGGQLHHLPRGHPGRHRQGGGQAPPHRGQRRVAGGRRQGAGPHRDRRRQPHRRGQCGAAPGAGRGHRHRHSRRGGPPKRPPGRPPASETLNQRDYPDLLHNQLAHLARRLDRLEGECGRGRSAR